MGVRFACHACGKHLNIKQELAGRRGVCPGCSVRFRIPLQDTLRSTPIENPATAANATTASNVASATNEASTTITTPATTSAVADSNSQTQPRNANEPASSQNTIVGTKSTRSAVSTLELLVGDPDATWYVRPPSGGQYGPANGDVLRQWIGEGRVAATALLWRDGWPQWREASEALPDLTVKGTGSTGTSPNPSEQLVNRASPDASAAQVASDTQKEKMFAEPTHAPSPSHQAAVLAQPDSSNAKTNGVSTITDSEKFGYEDSDFAHNKAYTNVSTQTPQLTGRDDVGSQRRDRSNRKTLSIVFLGTMVLLLIAAIAYLITR